MRWRRLFGPPPHAHADTPAGELARLTRQLRDNERIWHVFRELELRVVAARSLRELADVIATELPRAFVHVDCAALLAIDPDYELTRLVEYGAFGPPPAEAPAFRRAATFLPCTAQELHAWLGPAPYRPWLGVADEALQQRCFPQQARRLGSVALAPLVFQGRLIGCLAQGSNDPAHFTPSSATDLLEHLAAVVALSIDNQVNHERLKLDGLTDPLTGVANRRYCERRLAGEIERWRRRHEPLVCMLVDVDHFKRVNDQYGHQTGDAVLKQIATLLGEELRAADVLARYGGEEFLLLLPATRREQGAAIAERLRARVATHDFRCAALHLTVTVSIGLAALDAGATPPADVAAHLVQSADAALYRAKDAGRNRVVCA